MIVGLVVAAAIVAVSADALRRTARWLRFERLDSVDSAEYFDAVALELRRGSSLRQALAMPVPGSRLARLAFTGQPIDFVAAEVVSMVAFDDELTSAGIRLASRSGAPASKVFARLAERAREQRQHQRDRAAATAQARLSAAVIGLLPLGLGLATLALGGGRYLAQPGPARTAVMLGVGLQLVGLVVVAVLLRLER